MDYQINYTTNIEIKNKNYNLKSLTFLFLRSLCPIFESYVSFVLLYHIVYIAKFICKNIFSYLNYL